MNTPASPPKAGRQKNQRISITLRPRHLAQLDAIAHASEMARSQAAAVILENALAARESEGQRPLNLQLPQVGGAGA